MIELSNDVLVFSFPEVHRDAVLRIDFQRTLRIPDDDRKYPLPPGLGRFPLRHVDDHAARVPAEWLRRGGVMLPMYQSEALWLHFASSHGYPFAVKVAAGKVNAVTGDAWREELSRVPQDYVAVPEQPWLDGYCVSEGVIRQFVAMPLGSGYTVEEQVSGRAEHGGIQLLVQPLKREAYERMRRSVPLTSRYFGTMIAEESMLAYDADMGLGAGGQMSQEIYTDERDFADWDLTHRGRCFVHLTNSLLWRSITGAEPPATPVTAEEYTRAGLPWFEYYAEDTKALRGSEKLAQVKSIAQLGQERGDRPLPENTPVDPARIIELRAGLGKHQVREGAF
jgi:hypothetical protein